MKTVCKKLLSLMLVAILLVSAVPFQAFATTPYYLALWVNDATGYRYHPVVAGQRYDYMGSLPTPTSEHYDFVRWYKSGSAETITNESIVTDDVVVEGQVTLGAEWTPKKYNVSFQRFDLNTNGWVDVEWGVAGGQVNALSTISDANIFPTQAEIAATFALPGFSIVGWEIGDTDKAFVAGSTQVTGNMYIRPRYQRTVTLDTNNPSGTSTTLYSITVEIGEPIPKLPEPSACTGWTFVDWVASDATTVISTKANLNNTHANYTPAYGATFYARWTESAQVILWIHTQGNTTTASHVYYYDAPASGNFDTTQLNMYSIFPEYSKYDDAGDYRSSWYNHSDWKNYAVGATGTAATIFYDVRNNPDNQNLHIMLIDNGNNTTTNSNTTNNSYNNSYNNNINNADKTNPATGDYIMIAVTVMALSAVALIAIVLLKKRNTAK